MEEELRGVFEPWFLHYYIWWEEQGSLVTSWGLEGNSSTEMASDSHHHQLLRETAMLQGKKGREEFSVFAAPKS